MLKLGHKFHHFGKLVATHLDILGLDRGCMRFIKSFVLRLYIDSDEPDLLCGDLQAPSDQERFPFKNEVTLVELLHQFGALTAKNIHSNPRRPIHENKSID